jgi:pimeloyl-ACP methyl ester carboxylesterase
MSAETLTTVERLLDHVTTIPVIAGQKVQLYLREKARADLLAKPEDFVGVVLMLHGGFWPCTPAFDLDHEDYSWMAFLARRGWDVFAMDMMGYGHSTRPLMDDPRNLAPAQQPMLVPGVLGKTVAPPYPFKLVTSDSEAHDIDRVVDFIRDLRGVHQICLIGWSGGGCRSGTYTARHQEKISRLVIYASSNYLPDGSCKPDQIPETGAPMNLQTYDDFIQKRWDPAIRCADQVAPGMKDVAWRHSIESDPIGASWGPGGLRGPNRTYWGWNGAGAATLKLPTLVMIGEGDRMLDANKALFADLGARPKTFLEIACGSHFAQWEKSRHVLHRASAAWLETTTLEGLPPGRYRADDAGAIAPMT